MRTIRLKKNQRCLVVSDIHIGNGTKSIDKLMPLLDKYDFIIFNGDIFDLYLHKLRIFLYEKSVPFFKWMWENKDKFVYIVGNHDENLWNLDELDKPFFDLYESVRVIQKGKEFVVMHGHQFDENCRRTRWKTKFLYWLEYLSNIIFRVNWQYLIFKERKYFFNFANKKVKKALPEVRENARRYSENMKIKCLIHGHTHFPDNIIYNEGTSKEFRIIDQGSFQIGVSYVVIENGNAELKIVA